jgi:23S rRNA (cytosine1962-C5)-methyltransferase
LVLHDRCHDFQCPQTLRSIIETATISTEPLASPALGRVILGPKRARPFFGGHPWVYPGAIAAVEGEPADGDIVDLCSHVGNFIARGLYNSKSKIRVRLFSWADEPLDKDFFRTRLKSAVHLRQDILGMTGPGQACRLVFSEADGLPGCVVDQYDRWLIVQFTSLGLAQRREMFADLLEELIHPEGIYLRTERGIGQLEGLAMHDALLRGKVPMEPVAIDDGGVKFLVHLREGQKTGFYLDQRDNRQAVAQLARDRRVLDAFCYTGGFGLHALKAGAQSVLGLDVSASALELAQANASLNHLQGAVFEKTDVFDRLDSLVAESARFDLIVLDPPKFARSGNAIDEALRGYRRLQTQALRLLDADGILVVCCCTGLITQQMLFQQLAQLGADQHRGIQILEARGPSADHPIAANCLETDYLKCIVCRVR